MAHKLNTFHLFAGAGGGILADLLLDHNPIGACEIEPYPRNVLLARQRDGILPGFPIWDDVCTLGGKPWRGSVDVLCGGFPCQDISSAGKGAGITGARSGLWKEYARLIDEMRPRFVFAENSPLLRTRGLGVVLEDLAALGYDARWGIMGAWHVGAPHKRDRMWVLAYANSIRQQWTQPKQDQPHKRRGDGGCFSAEGSSLNGWEKVSFAGDCGISEQAGWWHTDPADFPNAHGQRFNTNGFNGGTEEEAGASSGTSTYSEIRWRPTEPLVGRVANGVAHRVDRLKAIGNGQVPQCAAMAFSILSEGLI